MSRLGGWGMSGKEVCPLGISSVSRGPAGCPLHLLGQHRCVALQHHPLIQALNLCPALAFHPPHAQERDLCLRATDARQGPPAAMICVLCEVSNPLDFWALTCTSWRDGG